MKPHRWEAILVDEELDEHDSIIVQAPDLITAGQDAEREFHERHHNFKSMLANGYSVALRRIS